MSFTLARDEFGYTETPQSNGVTALKDHNPATKYEISTSNGGTQREELNWDWEDCGDLTVNAVLIETDESVTTADTIEFWVQTSTGWVECPNSNGAGTGGVGGLFNCGVTGYQFAIDCINCPIISLITVSLWTEQAVLNATPYYLGNASMNYGDVNKLLGAGSYWYNYD